MTEHRELVERLAIRTIDLLRTEYPNGNRLPEFDAHGQPSRPSAIHPAFYGCYDWHSAAHSHWQLARALRTHPSAAFANAASSFLDTSLTVDNIADEMRWIASRPDFEMPYGMAWVLALTAELDAMGSEAQQWLTALRPLEQHARTQFEQYCSRSDLPIRGGMHDQSAFSLGLVWDAAVSLRDNALRDLVRDTALRLYPGDTDTNLADEPGPFDFLSPSLATAELVARMLDADDFGRWLDAVAPDGFGALSPVNVVDPADGQLAHWAGLNLSRSWMLDRIADALPPGDPRTDTLRDNAADHATVGLPMASHPEYMVSHWVPTFAVYLLTS